MGKKKIPDLNQYDPVEIEWIDSTELPGWNSHDNDDITLEDMSVVSTGIYCHHDLDVFVFCKDLSITQKGNIMGIPVVAIKQVTKLRK